MPYRFGTKNTHHYLSISYKNLAQMPKKKPYQNDRVLCFLSFQNDRFLIGNWLLSERIRKRISAR